MLDQLGDILNEGTPASSEPSPSSPQGHNGGSTSNPCSGISGLPGGDIRPENCGDAPTPAPRPTQPTYTPPSPPPAPQQNTAGTMSCGGSSDCHSAAEWNIEPYNHLLVPILLELFDGEPVSIPPNHTVWSVPDSSSPTGRRLEARPWNSDDYTPGLGSGNCAQEYTSAQSKSFIINLKCEAERQKKLAEEFSSREDTYWGDNDAYKCTSIGGSIVETPDVAKKSPDYWKQRPTVPARQCKIPRSGGRFDYKPMREPNWHTAKECTDNILGAYGGKPELPVQVNKRGVRGCRFIP